MNRFFGTFPAGAEEPVESLLENRLRDLKILALLNGAVEFETAVPYSDLNLFCFQNVFQVLHRGKSQSGEREPDEYLRELLSGFSGWEAAGGSPKGVKSFRLVISRENRLISVENGLRQRMEKKLGKATGLRVDRSRPDTEFWVLSRREGFCYFLRRLSRHRAYDKLLNPGELHPELAYLMCWLSSPKYTDVALDPFCGYGSIPAQRCRRFPYTKVYAFDHSEKTLDKAREKLPTKPGAVLVENRDALRLDQALDRASVDAVITDPPWGLYEDVGMGLEEFYRLALGQIDFVLKPGGRLVLLTAGKQELERAAKAWPQLALKAQYHILVSGKKCGLFLFKKEGGQKEKTEHE